MGAPGENEADDLSDVDKYRVSHNSLPISCYNLFEPITIAKDVHISKGMHAYSESQNPGC